MEYIKDNIKIEITKKKLDKELIHTFLDYSTAKVLWFDKTELSYKETTYEDSLLKKKFPGQTYITIPFTISFYGQGNICMENTKSELVFGDCRVSKRDIRTQYSMLKASKEEVLEKAYDLSQYTLNKFSSLLNGNVFDVSITDIADDNKEKYKFGNLIANKEEFYNSIITDILPIDLETRKALQSLIASEEFEAIFDTNNVELLFENLEICKNAKQQRKKVVEY